MKKATITEEQFDREAARLIADLYERIRLYAPKVRNRLMVMVAVSDLLERVKDQTFGEE